MIQVQIPRPTIISHFLSYDIPSVCFISSQLNPSFARITLCVYLTIQPFLSNGVILFEKVSAVIVFVIAPKLCPISLQKSFRIAMSSKKKQNAKQPKEYRRKEGKIEEQKSPTLFCCLPLSRCVVLLGTSCFSHLRISAK